jgi:DNA replication protein DnaC
MLTDLSGITQGLKALRLEPMAVRLQEWMAEPANHRKSQLECVEALMDAQSQSRTQARQRAFQLRADTGCQAALHGFEDAIERGLPTHVRANLATCEWVRQGHSLVLTGPSFSGKSFLALALAREALNRGYRTSYRRLSSVLMDYAIEKERGPQELVRFFRLLQKPALLVLDDFGLQRMTREQGHAVRQILDARERHQRALMVVSTKPPEQWKGSFNDPETADAVYRRVMAQHHAIELRGVFQQGGPAGGGNAARFNPRPPVVPGSVGQTSKEDGTPMDAERTPRRSRGKGLGDTGTRSKVPS